MANRASSHSQSGGSQWGKAGTGGPEGGMSLSPGRALLIPVAIAVALIVFGVLEARVHRVLFLSFVGAGAVVLAWAALLGLRLRKEGASLTLSVAIYKHHWVQACAQTVIYAWWAWHIRIVYAFIPLLIAQVVFAYAVDGLLSWSRRRRWATGFGPIPVIFSINLFLWFRPEWFYLQFVMILMGFLAKDLIRWTREGRSWHIFNPSSFPLAVFSLILIATQASDITFGSLIANTQSDPPFIYLVIFLASIPGQMLFGVARMTLPAVVTAYVISLAYFQATGTYLFFDSHIPVPVFLGMHLLFTDPSTSPRTEGGRLIFGVIYGLFTSALFVVLGRMGVPTFYDKLLPVPFMNLMVRGIDRFAQSPAMAALDPGRIAAGLTPAARHVAYTFLWIAVFAGMSSVQGVGDRHPGQYLPFWMEECEEGNDRACRYTSFMKLVYCENGSGWACNELGIEQGGRAQAMSSFQRACELGFEPGCANAAGSGAEPERAPPGLADLPILLRGTKMVLTERDPTRLYALACEQGWSEACAGPPSA